MATSAWAEKIHFSCDNTFDYAVDKKDYDNLKELKRDTSLKGLEIPDLNKLYVQIDETGSDDGWWRHRLTKYNEMEGEVVVKKSWIKSVRDYWGLERVTLQSEPISIDASCIYQHKLSINRQTLELRHTYTQCGQKQTRVGSCDFIKESEFIEKQLQITKLVSLTYQREVDRIIEQDKKLKKTQKF